MLINILNQKGGLFNGFVKNNGILFRKYLLLPCFLVLYEVPI